MRNEAYTSSWEEQMEGSSVRLFRFVWVEVEFRAFPTGAGLQAPTQVLKGNDTVLCKRFSHLGVPLWP